MKFAFGALRILTDLKVLECVQRRMANPAKGLEPLRKLGLFGLEEAWEALPLSATI